MTYVTEFEEEFTRQAMERGNAEQQKLINSLKKTADTAKRRLLAVYSKQFIVNSKKYPPNGGLFRLSASLFATFPLFDNLKKSAERIPYTVHSIIREADNAAFSAVRRIMRSL